MASVYDVVDALHAMGLEMKAIGDEAEKTVEKVREAKGESTTGGIQNQGTSSLTIATSDLGDPRNAIDTGMRMHAAIEAAKRR